MCLVACIKNKKNNTAGEGLETILYLYEGWIKNGRPLQEWYFSKYFSNEFQKY